MAILKDTILVATATLCVGSALMEIPSESKSFNKFFPYIGTFISAGIGYYFLRRSNMIKAAEYQPTQEMDDYSVNEITHSSAIEGFEPMKFSVVGNRAEGLETIFDAEGSFGDKPSINLSWKSYNDANEENKDKLALYRYLQTRKVLATNAQHLDYAINENVKVEYPFMDMNYTTMDLRGYFDFNGGRFYLIKYDFHSFKMKVKKGQSKFMVSPSYLVLYNKGDNMEMVSGASRALSLSQMQMVQPFFGNDEDKEVVFRNRLITYSLKHLGFLTSRKQATNEALQYLYFNCLTPELELDFDESMEVASSDFGIERFQNMIIPYTYKVKDPYKKTRKITNYYYVDEYGNCKFFIAICINQDGTLRFMGDTKQRNGTSTKINTLGAVDSVTKILEYRPILKYWLKSVVMDSANLSKRRINMWNNDREQWLKQQYAPMLFAKWLPVLFSKHTSLTALDYIRFMKSCLASSVSMNEEHPATHKILMNNPNELDDNVALEMFKKYYPNTSAWEHLAYKWRREEPSSGQHIQFYNNIDSLTTSQLMRSPTDFNYGNMMSQIYSILDTDITKNTIVPIASWFGSGMPNVLPLEISNTKDLKVRAFRKLYNKYDTKTSSFWTNLEENSYYTNELDPEEEDQEDYEPTMGGGLGFDYEMLKNMINDPMKWPSNPFVKEDSYKGYNEEMEAESSKPHSVTISRSSNSEKKLMAVFEDSEGKKIKTTHFGQRGASDYTKHGDKERMQRYLERHGGGTTTSTKEDWKDPTTAGSLSRWILWNKPSLSASFSDYKSRFGLKGSINVSKSAEERRRLISELVCFKCGVKDEIANYNWNENAKGCCGMGVRVKEYYAKSAEERKCKSCEKPATTVVQEGSYCYECLPINLGAENQPLCANKPCIRIANGTDGIGFCMPCEDDASNNRLVKEATEWVGFCPECNKWRTKDMSKIFKNNRKDKNDEEYITDLAFNGWTIPKKLLGKQLCMRGQRFGGNVRNQTDSFTGYGQRTHNNSYCGTPLTKVKSKYKAEYEAKSPAQKSLDDWNDEDWKTKSGKPSGETGERFLPTKAIESLTDKEYKETSDKKRKDSKKGKQFSDQPKSIAEKTAKYRTETFEAIEGTGSNARFTDTPDSKVYRDTSLRQKARNSILKGTKGGNAGQWSAIKANLSASKYRSLYENKYGEGKNPYF